MTEVLTPALTLYIAGQLPNSRRACAHLNEWLRACGQSFPLEVVDVLDVPARAAAERIFYTPMLVITSEARRDVLVGDLSDAAELDRLLAPAMAP
jgi:hypothetical protein